MCIFTLAFAQEASPTKKSNQFIGFQANQLIRQILNFSNSSSAVTNPYAFTFAANSIQTGRGINIGIGYSFSQSNDGDAFSQREIKVDDFFFRLGWERKRTLSGRWILSYGVDFVGEVLNNTTETRNSSNDFKVTTTSRRTGAGLGPRFTLNYELTEKIWVGTEVNYYYVSGKDKSEVKTTFTTTEVDPFTGQIRHVRHTDVTDSSEKSNRFQFNVPAVIFLILKF